MKFLKILLMLVGLAGFVAGALFLGMNWVDLGKLLAAANTNKSGNLFPDPMPRIYLTSGLLAAGGLLLGIGLGLPNRTAGQVRKEALDTAAAQRQAEIRGRVAPPDQPQIGSN
jgi:hypothetical protein